MTHTLQPSIPHARRAAASLFLCAILSACGGSSNSDGANGPQPSPGAPPPAASPSLNVSADRAVATAGGEAVTLNASLADVTWTLESGSPGRLDASSGTTVRYFPPPSGSISGSIVINIVATAGGMNKQISIVLEGGATAPGAPIPNPVAPARLVIAADAERALPGGSGITLSASAPEQASVQWSLAPGSPGSLSASSGESVVYLPPPMAGARETPVTVVAQANGQEARLTLLLQGEQGLSLLAGNDFGAGMRDGAGAGARFAGPIGVVRDAQGNLYVADTRNHTIRRIAPDNTVTTIAGKAGTAGHVDGSGADARLNKPAHITLGSDGNLYFTDISSHTVRRVTPGGLVGTVAGQPGSAGDTDGLGGGARFNHPIGIGADLDGNLYVADSHNSLVRRIAPDGTVDTYAGLRGQRSLTNGERANATFIDPQTLTVDVLGNVYVSDGFFRPPEPNTIAGRSVIRKLAADGAVSTLAGGFVPETAEAVDGTGPEARFFDIFGMQADATGNLFLGADRLRHVSPDGVVSTLLARTPGQLNKAGSIALDSAGTVYFADYGDHVVRALDTDGGVATLAGTAPRSGSADGTGSDALFNRPEGIAVDAAGNLYVADTLNHTIRAITPTGMVSTRAGSAGSSGSSDGNGAAARFFYPEDVAADADGTLYVADTLNYTVRRVAPGGMVTTLAGSAGNPGHADGSGAAARFGALHGIVLAPDGNLYVSDPSNHTIRRITPEGEVSTLAGSPGQYGHVDASGSAARFNAPGDLAVDGAGNLYLLDGSSMVRRVTPEGAVTTVAGSPGQWGRIDASGSSARFHAPQGITLGDDGNLYVADSLNHAVRRVTPQGVVTTVAGSGEPDGLAEGSLYRPTRIVALGDGVLALTAGNGVFRLSLP